MSCNNIERLGTWFPEAEYSTEHQMRNRNTDSGLVSYLGQGAFYTNFSITTASKNCYIPAKTRLRSYYAPCFVWCVLSCSELLGALSGTEISIVPERLRTVLFFTRHPPAATGIHTLAPPRDEAFKKILEDQLAYFLGAGFRSRTSRLVAKRTSQKMLPSRRGRWRGTFLELSGMEMGADEDEVGHVLR